MKTRPKFFKTPGAWRAWLEKHHLSHSEIAVGFYRTGSGRPSITWPESVDQALCFGWIDGVRHSIDEVSYQIRFTPRKPTSTWSAVNVARVEELTKSGEMAPAGLTAFANRNESRSGIYAYENRKKAELPPEFLERMVSSGEGWEYFSKQPDGYKKTAIWWVVSAKRQETRERRLEELIFECSSGRRLKQFRP